MNNVLANYSCKLVCLYIIFTPLKRQNRKMEWAELRDRATRNQLKGCCFVPTTGRRLLKIHLVYVSLINSVVKPATKLLVVSVIKMLRTFFSEAYNIQNVKSILRGSPSVKSIYTSSKSFQIVPALQELDRREEKVVDTLFNGLLSSNRACLAKSITLTESTHPRKRLQARSLLKKALQHCKQCQQNNNSYSFRIGTYMRFRLREREKIVFINFVINIRIIRSTRCWKINIPGKHGKVSYKSG